MKNKPTGLTATIVAEEEIARVGDRDKEGNTFTLDDLREVAEIDNDLVLDEKEGVLRLVLREEGE